MNIVVKNDGLKPFGQVLSGMVFRVDYEEGSAPTYAMKIDEVYDEENHERLNCVDMADGSWFYLEDDCMVYPHPDAKLIIE